MALDATRGPSDEAHLLRKLQQEEQQQEMLLQQDEGHSGGTGRSQLPLAVALGTHALLEAMVVGTTQTNADVWIASLAILGHKGAEAVALASAFLKAGGSVCVNVSCFSAFVAATPIGVLVGSFVAQGGMAAAGVLNALAVGVILYACIELLAEFSTKAPLSRRLLRCFAFLCGLSLLFGLDLLHAPMCRNHNHVNHCHHYHSSSSGPQSIKEAQLQQPHHHHHPCQHASNPQPPSPAAAAAAEAFVSPPTDHSSGEHSSTLRGSSPTP